jgi:hypothetical protein
MDDRGGGGDSAVYIAGNNKMGSAKMKHVMNTENFHDCGCSVSFVCRSSCLLCSYSILVVGS